MDHCTCEPGRHHDGTERGLCEFCEAEGDREATAPTPGPWHVVSDLNNRPIVKAGGTIHVADLYHAPGKTIEANARLIAAAPDLLAACAGWINYMADDGTTDGDGDHEDALMNAMRAAIAKAEGKPFPDLRTGGGR